VARWLCGRVDVGPATRLDPFEDPQDVVLARVQVDLPADRRSDLVLREGVIDALLTPVELDGQPLHLLVGQGTVQQSSSAM